MTNKIFKDAELDGIVEEIQTKMNENTTKLPKLSTWIEINMLTFKFWKTVGRKVFE
jgi:hypothetical protein